MFKVKFWSLAVLILLPGVALMLMVTEPVYQAVRGRAAEHLAVASALVESQLALEANKLVEMAAGVAALPDVRAALVESGKTGDKRLATAMADVRAGSGRFFLVLTKDGRAAFRTDHPERTTDSFAGLPLVQEGLAGVRRDGVWLLGEVYHRVAIVPVKDRTSVVGAVLLADPVTQEDAEAMAKATKLPVVLMVDQKVLGSALGQVDVRLTEAPTPFGAAEAGMPPFPLLLPEAPHALLGRVVPVVDAWPSLRVAVAVPYVTVFESVAALQFWIAAVALLGLLVVLAWSTLVYRDITKPLDRITTFLSAANQGNGEGILPESGMGPYLRLAKLVNMLVEKRGASAGRSPVSLSSGNSGEMVLPRARTNSSPSAVAAPPPPPAVSEPPAAKGSGSNVMEELFGPAGASLPPPAKAAEAKASSNSVMEELFGPAGASAPPPAKPAEAKPSANNVMEQLFGSDAGAAGARKPAAPPVPPPSVATMPPAAVSAAASMAAADGFGGNDRTVAVSTPAALLAATVGNAPVPAKTTTASALPITAPVAVSVPPPAVTAPPAPAAAAVTAPPKPAAAIPPSEATVMVAIPQELLAKSAGAPVDEEEAHYRDVYQQFLRTREQCNEPAEDLTYERFVGKLQKNKQQLLEKYACRTVRFQVYVKQGKAALKAVPVRD